MAWTRAHIVITDRGWAWCSRCRGSCGPTSPRALDRRTFTISSHRLRVDLSYAPASDALRQLVSEVWLELAFEAGAYLGVPLPEQGSIVRYEEFVPAGLPPPAEVPGRAPSWLSINVPPSVDLLKTVTATLRHCPGRPRPSPQYFETCLY